MTAPVTPISERPCPTCGSELPWNANVPLPSAAQDANRESNRRLYNAAERADVLFAGCDTPDHLADAIVDLRARLAAAEAERQAAEDRELTALRAMEREMKAARAAEAERDEWHAESDKHLDKWIMTIAQRDEAEAALARLQHWTPEHTIGQWLGDAQKRLDAAKAALAALVNAVEDAMETPEEAASWARTGDMNGYLADARAVLGARGGEG